MRQGGRGAALLALGLALGLALACGGGGGGNGSDATAEITADNAAAITSEVLLGIQLTAEASTVATGILLEEVGPTAASTTAVGAAAAATSAAAPTLAAAGGAASGAGGPITEACAAGGSVTLSGTRAAVDQPSVGDSLQLAYEHCDEGDGVPIDGDLVYSILSLAGDIASDFFSVRLNVFFDHLVRTDATDKIETRILATTNYDTREQPRKKSSIAGSAFLRCEAPNVSDQLPCDLAASDPDSSKLGLKNFATSLIQYVDPDGVEADAVDAKGLLVTNKPPFHDDAVAYDTAKPLDPDHEDDTVDDEIDHGEYVVGGDLLITGAGGATIRLVELAPPDVELQVIEANGQTTTIPTTWDALLD